MIAQKRVFIQKTPLDIPLGLFLLAHILSTIFSIDTHISLWGYYSRFNGGLLSMLSYIFLYYALVSNFGAKVAVVKRLLFISLATATLVAAWGLPSHFGYDPTCLLFRGTFDVSCWTEAFQPKIRIFSTLGQPNWLAAYLSILLPIALTFGLNQLSSKTNPEKKVYGSWFIVHGRKNLLIASSYLLIAILFYVDIIYTDSQSGFLGTVVGIGVFLLWYLLLEKTGKEKKKVFSLVFSIGLASLLLSFFTGSPLTQLKPFTLSAIQKNFTSGKPNSTAPTSPKQTPSTGTALEGGGTNSGTIRGYVWKGAIDAWKDNPLFGTGVETFAFAYYKYRPVGHNMTSEWDYLYNKAHNEYLNYLATTGALGLGSYLLLIGMFLWITSKYLLSIIYHLKSNQIINDRSYILVLALMAGYVSILISNFFGFSVVLVNIYLFIIPAFVFMLAGKLSLGTAVFRLPNPSPIQTQSAHSQNKPSSKITTSLSGMQWSGITVVIIFAMYQLILLTQFWLADTAYALAQNYDHIGRYNEGYKNIRNALALRGDEPVFKEELAVSDAAIAVALNNQKQPQLAAQLADEATRTINQLVTDYPNNLNFLKSKVRVYYTLGQINPSYLALALQAIQKTQYIAPTDAKISYNLGVLYGQTGQVQKGIEVLQNTIKLKPDYYEAYYALGLFYHDAAVATDSPGAKTNNVIHPEMEQKAVEQMRLILKLFGKDNKAALDALKSWGEK